MAPLGFCCRYKSKYPGPRLPGGQRPMLCGQRLCITGVPWAPGAACPEAHPAGAAPSAAAFAHRLSSSARLFLPHGRNQVVRPLSACASRPVGAFFLLFPQSAESRRRAARSSWDVSAGVGRALSKPAGVGALDGGLEMQLLRPAACPPSGRGCRAPGPWARGAPPVC